MRSTTVGSMVRAGEFTRRGSAARGGRRGSSLAAVILAATILASPPPAAAQEVTVSVGPDTAANLAPGDTLGLPIQVDFSSGDVSLADLELVVGWNADRLGFVAAEAGDFGSVAFDETGVGAGELAVSVSSATGTSEPFTAATLFLAAGDGSGTTQVTVEVTAASSGTGEDLSSRAEGPRARRAGRSRSASPRRSSSGT